MFFVSSGNTLDLCLPCPCWKVIAVSRLSEALWKANLEHLGVRDISRRAKELGVTLSPSNISNYLRGNHPERPPAKTLAAFAKVFDVPVSDLEDAAAYTGREPFTPDPSSDRLTAPQRAAVNEIIRLLADGNTGAGESNGSPMNDAGGKPADDGLGAFGHRDRGDHESVNDGTGDNVRHLRETPYYTPPPPAEKTVAWETGNRGRKLRQQQDEDAEGSQDENGDEEE